MVKLKRRSLILAKIESTYGTDPTPTGSANAILAMDPNIKETFEAVERPQLASMSIKPSLGAKRFAEITFKTELIGSGTAGTAPRLGALLKACAFAETVSVGSSVTYNPVSSPTSSITVYLYLDGMLHKLTGAVGTVKLSLEAGKTGVLDFSFKGIYNAPTDTTLATPTFETTVDSVPIVKSSSLTYNANSSLYVNKADMDIANTIALRPSVNATNAVAGFQVTSRKPNISIDPEVESIATIDWRTDLLSTPRAFSMVVGATAGNIITFSIPKMNVVDIQYGDRDGILTNTIKAEMTANTATGDDELSIKFT
mgnify:CR=1 FL=1